VSDLNLDYALLLPEFVLALTGLAVLLADAFRSELKIGRSILPGLTMLGALAYGVLGARSSGDEFAGIFAIDAFTAFFRVLFAVTLVVVVIGSHEYVTKNIRHQGEFYAMLLFASVGASFMAGGRELLTAYVGIELLSFSLYVAVSLAKSDTRSAEAGLKYVLLGGLASATLLYGLSLVYGAGGSTTYTEIAKNLEAGAEGLRMPLVLGLVMVIAGLGFKASAVPFHMWTPDAYEGAPLPVTAILSATSKAAAFAVILRLFSGPFLPVIGEWRGTIAVLSLATMVVGNLIALQQHNLKRLLAYSSIAQVGYMLMAVLTMSDVSASVLLLHLGGYLVTNLAVFMGVIAFYNHSGTEEMSGLHGLAETNPFLAMVLATGLLSLSGMPLLAGFTTKFMLFQAVASGGYLWLVTIAVIMSTISLYYYLKVIRQMYVVLPDGSQLPYATEPSVRQERWRMSPSSVLVTSLLLAGIVAVGLYVAPLAVAADQAAKALFKA
jgi:NADH-quinone oxidoreductase subunit N